MAHPGFKVDLMPPVWTIPALFGLRRMATSFWRKAIPEILIFRGMTSDGKPEQSAIFASGLKRPYGLAFYPPGPDPQYLYVGSERELVRFAYHNGDLKASGAPEHIADLPGPGGHWTRAVVFSQDGKKLFVAVGSGSNIDDPDTTPREKNRADILWCDPANCKLRCMPTAFVMPGAEWRSIRRPVSCGAR